YDRGTLRVRHMALVRSWMGVSAFDREALRIIVKACVESVRKSGVIPYIYDSIVRMSRWFRFFSNETLKFCESYPLGGLGWLLVLKAVHCSTPDFLTLSTKTGWLLVLLRSLLNVEDLNVPLPHMQSVANVEELFLPVQSELVQGFATCRPPKAVELLGLDTKDVAQIATPPEDG